MKKKASIIFTLVFVAMIGASSLSVASAEQQAAAETETQQAVRQEIEQRRVDIRSVMKERRDRMQDQLKAISSERKREAIEKISASITAINDRMVDHYLDVVGQIESVYLRLVEKLDQADRSGTPTGQARNFAVSARDAIVAARSAVTSQSGVIYNLEVGDEGVLRIEMQNTRNTLKADLQKIKESIKAARSAVVQMIIEFNRAQPK